MKNNIMLNVAYKILITFMPIIIIPYITRILGADGYGEFILAETYAKYGILFGEIGLTTYAIREIAFVKQDKETLVETFWEIVILRTIFLAISTGVYIVIIFNYEYSITNICASIYIIASLFDVSWLFLGMEKFKNVVVISSIFQILAVVLIFILVNNESDVWKYVMIMAGALLAISLIMWGFVFKEIKEFRLQKHRMKKHIKVGFTMFLPQIAIQFYLLLDRIMLGIFTTDSEVGIYEASQKIVRALTQISGAITSAAVPTMASKYIANEMDEFKESTYSIFRMISCFTIAGATGLIVCSENFIGWYFGAGFEKCELLITISAVILISVGWTSVLGNQVLVVVERQKQLTIAVALGALFNVIANIFLIQSLQSLGATIATIGAELLGLLIMLYYVRDILEISNLMKGIVRYIVVAMIMFIVVKLSDYCFVFIEGISRTIIQGCIGSVTYITILFFIKDEVVLSCISLLKKYKNKIRINRNR